MIGHSRVSRLVPMLTSLILIGLTIPAMADAPKVKKLVPHNGDTQVDPGLREIRVLFDRDMDTSGFSLCGGGDTFPTARGKPKWVDARTFVMKVRLKPNHEYKMSVNCPSTQNFRSKDGTPLEAQPWTFTTASKPKEDGKKKSKTKKSKRQKKSTTPEVEELHPENGDTNVKPDLKELRVVFDRDMQTGGFSLCGGGPLFPEIRGKPKWVDARTLVVKVRLEPDHDYQLAINCPGASNFRSAEGTPVEPLRWTFSTAPDKANQLSKKEQRALNKKCLTQLMKLLETRYSYYEVRDVDWKELKKKHRKKIENAKSARDWIKQTAKMLSSANDMHLWLKYKDNLTPTFSRDVRRNFTLEGTKTALPSITQRNQSVFTARTGDDIGYIMITSLAQNRAEQLEEVQAFLEEYKNCKGLILDLRANSGGAEPLAMPIASWFINGKKIYAKHVSCDPESKSGFSKAYERTIEGNDAQQRFSGPVAVLTGPGIMSSCEAFVLMMKQGEDVKLIGATTYGSSGNPHPHLLDNGVEAFLPSWKAMRPNGSCFEGEGIRPDIKVKAKSSAFKTGDPVLERALKYLRERSSKNE